MKLEWKTCFRAVVSVFVLFLCVEYWSGAVRFLLTLLSAATPLFVGCVIAYLINILMSFYERHYFPNRSSAIWSKSRRLVCMLAAILTLISIAALVINLVVPELASCVRLLVSEVPDAIDRLVDGFVANAALAELIPENIIAELNSINWKESLSQIIQFLSSGISGMAGAVTTVVTSVFSVFVTTLISIIFSVYLLLGKDKLKGQCDRLMRNYLRPSWRQGIEYVCHVLDDSFHRYIVGQCIEAVILGTLCALGMFLFRFPYAVMIGALVSFTALIPIAGAYIGAGVGAVMMLTVSPMKALLFLIFIAVLQQLEGNLIYPKVVGTSIGLPGLWVLTAITVGGSLMGIVGMLIGVPITAALYRLLREDMERREQKRRAAETSGQNAPKKGQGAKTRAARQPAPQTGQASNAVSEKRE